MLIIGEALDKTLAVMRVDRSRTLSALMMTLPDVPDEPAAFRRMDICCPTAKSVGAANKKPPVLTVILSA